MKKTQLNFNKTGKSKTCFIFCVTFCVTFLNLCHIAQAKPVITLKPGQCIDLGLEKICAAGSDETYQDLGTEKLDYHEYGDTSCLCVYEIHTGNPAKGWWLKQVTETSEKMLKNYGSNKKDCVQATKIKHVCLVGTKSIRYRNYRGN